MPLRVAMPPNNLTGWNLAPKEQISRHGRCEKEDGNIGVSPGLPHHFKAIQAGKHQVENEQGIGCKCNAFCSGAGIGMSGTPSCPLTQQHQSFFPAVRQGECKPLVF